MFDEMMGTKPVSERQRFDLDALARWMRTHVADVPGGALQVEQFKGGQSNPTFKISAGTGAEVRQYVLRTKPGPAARLLPSAHAIEREFRVMDALHRAGFPAPRQIALCLDEAVIGRAFYLMDYVEGRILWDQSLPGMTPDERAAIYDEQNRVIARLHTLDAAALGLADFGKPGNYFARQIERWTRQYRACALEPIEAMERLIEWLPQHIPPGEQSAVVHGDYRLDNLIFHPTEPRILAVLDWELSTLGHPLADFSYHCLSWHIPPGQFRGIAGLDLASLGIPGLDDYVAAYSRRTGLQLRREDFNFYFAYNLFRLAGIMQGIMKRYVDGTASSAQALENGKAARPMADMAWKFALMAAR